MKILVIEDEPKVVACLKKGLEENGYEVDVAYDGQIGERLVTKENYNLVLLDIIIPGINGIELCKRIREKNNQVPVLMLTALGTTNDKVEGFIKLVVIITVNAI